MSQESPEFTLARQHHVEQMLSKQREEAKKHARDLEIAQNETQDFLLKSNLDRTIRKYLFDQKRPYRSTKTGPGIPLDGNLLSSYQPAFVIDHQGVVGFSKRYEYPGFKYSFQIGLDLVTITLNLCRNEKSEIIAIISFSYQNGRTHQIDHESYVENPSEMELINWLNLELYEVFPSENLYQLVMANNFLEK